MELRSVERCGDDVRQEVEDARLEPNVEHEWIAVLGHELRSPVGALALGIEVVKRKVVDVREFERNIEMMERQIRHVTRLLDDLPDVSRLTRNRLSVVRDRVDLLAVSLHAIENVSPLIRARGHDLRLALPPKGTIWVNGDHDRLVQVLVNLLANAAKYTQLGGRIGLDVAADSERARIVVRDTGIGISRDALPRVFDLFWRGRERDGMDHGLGLGLALVQSLVRLHGGNVTASSAGAGQGSEFGVELPLIA